MKGARVTQERIDLKGEKETLLMTLYLRALDSRAAAPILGDEYAEELMSRIDYNFDRLAPMRGNASTIAVRAKQLYAWTRQFLAEHPDAVVLHLACGLDSRVFRIDRPRSALWLDLDYPEVIRLRERLYPAGDGVVMIDASVTDESWWAQVPSDRPTLVLGRGVVDVSDRARRAQSARPGDRSSALWPGCLRRRQPMGRDGLEIPASLPSSGHRVRLLPTLRNSMRLLRYTF
jgi:hypothetical protein